MRMECGGASAINPAIAYEPGRAIRRQRNPELIEFGGGTVELESREVGDSQHFCRRSPHWPGGTGCPRHCRSLPAEDQVAIDREFIETAPGFGPVRSTNCGRRATAASHLPGWIWKYGWIVTRRRVHDGNFVGWYLVVRRDSHKQGSLRNPGSHNESRGGLSGGGCQLLGKPNGTGTASA